MVSAEDLLALKRQDWDVDWEPACVVEVHRATIGSMVRHIPELVEAAQKKPWAPSYDPYAFDELCGKIRSSTHAFAMPPLDWGFRLTEPQVTSALAYFLSPTVQGEVASQRCAAFVRALYRAAGLADGAHRLNPTDAVPGTLRVDAERRTGTRRVDIALEWCEGDDERPRKENRRLVLIECKFDHHVTCDQLPTYQRFAQVNTGAGGYALFLICDRMTSRTGESIAHNQAWQPVTWRTLLRRWEQELEGLEAHAEFARLRRTIWDMCKDRSF